MNERQFQILIGSWVRAKRRAADLTQSELAKRVGIPSASAGYICDIEKGRKSLNAYLLYRIEKEVGEIWPS